MVSGPILGIRAAALLPKCRGITPRNPEIALKLPLKLAQGINLKLQGSQNVFTTSNHIETPNYMLKTQQSSATINIPIQYLNTQGNHSKTQNK